MTKKQELGGEITRFGGAFRAEGTRWVGQRPGQLLTERQLFDTGLWLTVLTVLEKIRFSAMNTIQKAGLQQKLLKISLIRLKVVRLGVQVLSESFRHTLYLSKNKGRDKRS